LWVNKEKLISSGVQSESHDKSGLKQIQIIGRLALALGLLAMMIGLYSAFSAIEGQEVSQSILAGGLKVASIAPMYGLIIYSIAQLASFFIIRRK